jgi:multiple sugar transport system ATP-binding protein
MSKIEFHQVCKRYPGAPAWTINNAELTIDSGKFCVFVGPSGCGKSTLLRMVAGLEDITSGEISIDGKRVNDVAPAQHGVAIVFQSYALYPHMTVRQNMGCGLKVLGSDKDKIEAKVRDAAEILRLTPLLDRLPRNLSGGQRQRVAIGRAIVKDPRVFLFDEPLSNLDAALRVQTRLEIAKLHEEHGSASMIYVTHDQVEAMTLADKIVLLYAGADVQTHGSVAQFGTPLDLYHRPANRFVAEFIGSPKMNVLPGELVSATAESAEVRVVGMPLTARVDATQIAKGAALGVGMRPENIRVVDAPGANRLPAVISHIELLGESSLLYVEPGPNLPFATVKVEGTTSHRAGDKIQLEIPAESVYVFGPDQRGCRRTVELPA